MKSILLHVYEDSGFEARLSGGLDLARACEGHITCLHATPYEDYLAVDPFVVAALPEDFSDKMVQLRIELQARVEDRLRKEGASWDWIHVNERISTALIRFSILCDVVVVTLADGAIERDNPRPLAAAVATGSRAPVLALPEQLSRFDPNAPILIAWNGSPEAAAAVHAALPLLKRAARVVLLEVEEKLTAYPRDLVARYLSRHGVHVEILQRLPVEGRIGVAIVEAALDEEAGLVVMGAYGHSRLREFLLGGVTRALIHNSPLPLLLAH
jgi:nucleotide-binding universal stress UspA family protein